MRGGIPVALFFASIVLAAQTLSAAEPLRVGETTSEPRQPQAAMGGEGTVHVAFGSGDAIYYSALSPNASSFSRAVVIHTSGRLSLGMRRGPRIAATNGELAVSAIVGLQGGGRDGDLLAWRSSDGGKRWRGPVRVNDVGGSAREGLHAMGAAGDGRLYCVWLDLRNGSTEIYGAASTDGGASWTENQCIYRSPSGSVCECCHPSVAFDSENRLHVMWRNSLEGDRDMFLVHSDDGGLTFGRPERLGDASWPLDACPMDGGSLAIDGETIVSVWRRDRQIVEVSPGGKERLLGEGLQPWCAASSAGAYFAWIGRRPGDLWLQSPGAPRPEKIAERAADPVVVASTRESGPVVILWESEEGGSPAILCKRVVAGD